MNKKRWIILAIVLLVAALLIAAIYLSSPVHRVERAALDQLGKPYVFGTDGPDSFDCSGLMRYAYLSIGVELSHSTHIVAADEQYETIDDSAHLRRGDLVFFDTISNDSQIDHVGLWLGRNRFVHASSAGGEVMVSEFDDRWQQRFVLAKRIL